MLSRDQSLRSDAWNLSGTQGNVFGNSRAVIDSSQIPYQGTPHSTSQSATGGKNVWSSKGRLVAKDEEQIGSTVPMPSFARRPSTMNSFSPTEKPQNSMANQQKLQISELHFEKFPTPSTFWRWKMRHKTQVLVPVLSRRQCERSTKWTGSIRWMILNHRDQFRSLNNSKILRCWTRESHLLLKKIIQDSHFKKKVSLEDQKTPKKDRFLRGRQIAYMIYSDFRVTGAQDIVLDYADLFSITLRNDDV